MKKPLAIAVAAASLLLASSASATVVLSQNFEGINPANPGFQTAYNYRSGTTNKLTDRVNSMYDERTWTIGDNPFDSHSHWKNKQLDGNALIVNGLVAPAGSPPSLAWAQSANLVAGHYTFSFDALDVCCISSGYANATSYLTFDYVIGDPMGRPITDFTILSDFNTTMAPSADGFYHISGSFDLGAGFSDTPTSVSFNFHNWLGSRNGNDFAIDNILVSYADPPQVEPQGPTPPGSQNVAAVPEPSTWLMMLAGFGALGAILRRNRRALAAATA